MRSWSPRQAQLVEARNNHERMRDLVAENAVSRAAVRPGRGAAADGRVAGRGGAGASSTWRENRLSYTRLFADVAGVVTARGPEPGEVVSAGRMVVQVAREGARDAVFDVPAQVKDSAPRNSDITVALVRRPQGHAPRARCARSRRAPTR